MDKHQLKNKKVSDYEPVHFIRCHSGELVKDDESDNVQTTDNDPSDCFTEVWMCKFEPKINCEGTTNVVATCGGDTVCLIDCESGTVIKRYRAENEHFFCLTWTTFELFNKDNTRSWKANILIVSGKRGNIKLIYPDQLICYSEFRGCKQKNIDYIGCLLVNPHDKTELFCGAKDGSIFVWKLAIPNGSSFKTNNICLGSIQCGGKNVTNMVTSISNRLFFAGTDEGIFACKFKKSFKDFKHKFVQFCLPMIENAFIDALTLLTDDLIACKSSTSEFIYIWSISEALKIENSGSLLKISVNPQLKLRWCKNTTEYLGVSSQNGLVVSGTDTGDIWIYNLKSLFKQVNLSSCVIDPSRILHWPTCKLDKFTSYSYKMSDVLSNKKIAINMAAWSGDNDYLVAGTSTNLVCIWKSI